MLNVTIQNDGKIKFQSECSSTDEDEVEKAAKKFDSSECLKVCISKH